MHSSKYGQNILGRKYKALSSCSKDRDLQKRAPVLFHPHSATNVSQVMIYSQEAFTPRRDGGHVKAKVLGSHSPKGQEGGSEVIERKPLA